MTDTRIALIGFGEAAQAFAAALTAPLVAYDRKVQIEATREAKHDEMTASGVDGMATNREAATGAATILSLVTADEALAAAIETAESIGPGALFCDMNSVAPDTKRAAARAIQAAGGRYADVAVMAPVCPAGLAAPLLVAGTHAAAARDALATAGFANVRVVAGRVGTASSIKMIRSVMVKGLEALSAECAIAAQAAGVLDEVVATLDASWPGAEWSGRLDYHLDRMMVHGLRRAAEMREAAATLVALGVDPAMTRGTIDRQEALGALHLPPPAGLAAKLAVLAPCGDNHSKEEAA